MINWLIYAIAVYCVVGAYRVGYGSGVLRMCGGVKLFTAQQLIFAWGSWFFLWPIEWPVSAYIVKQRKKDIESLINESVNESMKFNLPTRTEEEDNGDEY
jgi:hypothetical protein